MTVASLHALCPALFPTRGEGSDDMHYDIDLTGEKHGSSIFYILIKRGFLTNQNAHRIQSILQISGYKLNDQLKRRHKLVHRVLSINCSHYKG